jgi:glucose dehydrogenase
VNDQSITATTGITYSPLAQIDASNFNQLEVAWRFKTDNLGTIHEFKLEGTPLMVGGVVYTTAGTRRAVVALDAGTGELRWVHGEPTARAAQQPLDSCLDAASRTGPTARTSASSM